MDDRETTRDERFEAAAKGSPLPERVERALARAREAVKADRARKGGRWLAAIPATVGVIFLLLMMPRAAVPEAVPMPQIDLRKVADVERADDARAQGADAERLPADVLAVGTAIRHLNGADARGKDELETIDARRILEGALRELGRRPEVVTDLLALRAVQTRRFLDAVAHWETTGETSEDFVDLAASFIQRSMDAGWVEGRRVLPGVTERRVMFKTVWNVLTGFDTKPELALTLDEQRVLHSFYLRHPHPPESRRLGFEAQRQAAATPEACARANVEQGRQAELWRAEKIKKLGQIDPSYPTAYALGVVYYRAGRFDLSAESFTTFLGAQPDGPYALRAKNHLKAALVAGGSL